MAEDSERSFQKIMNKLYHSSASKPKNPSLSSGNGIGKRRAESGFRASTGAIGSVGLVPPCRPWDRGDLMRRLATFKAMTWFGKPKAISAVNCARRGWINIEMDVITCEACGARLLFSTPSSWSLEQVEKAAAVFSLKLDNGHKLLCPWTDNACDETLALFPSTPPPTLVDGYRERSTALSRLTALPVVSSSAIDYMKSPQLEHFLSESSPPSITLNNGIRLTKDSRSKDLEDTSEAINANIYFQAQKIISLCGWEPRLLPYVVDCNNQPSTSSAERLSEQKHKTTIYSSTCLVDDEGRNDNHPLHSEFQYDPACVVLDCKLCGACVGLWSFTTIQRPLESFTFDADPSNQNESSTSGADKVSGSEILSSKGVCDTGKTSSTSKERSLGLNLTIAGGPPPTKQNFRPIVSFPIVSRHLRSEFASGSHTRDYVTAKDSYGSQVNAQLYSQNDVSSPQQKNINGDLVDSLEDAVSLKRKRSENDDHVSRSNNINDLSHVNGEISADVGNGLGIGKKSRDSSSEGMSCDALEIHSLQEGNGDNVHSKEIMQERKENLEEGNVNSEVAEENVLRSETETGDSVDIGENLCKTPNADANERDSGTCENNLGAESGDVCKSCGDPFPRGDSLSPLVISKDNHCDPSHIASCSTNFAPLLGYCTTEIGEGNRRSDFQNFENAKANVVKDDGVKAMVLTCANREEKAEHSLGINLKAPQCDTGCEFDTIRQHRPFCPWIASEGGKSIPGWKLTLTALVQHEKDSSSDDAFKLDPPSSLLDEEEDPVVSIRRLFMSPPPKRLKRAP